MRSPVIVDFSHTCSNTSGAMESSAPCALHWSWMGPPKSLYSFTFSNTFTFMPRRCRESAVMSPAMPPPATRTVGRSSLGGCFLKTPRMPSSPTAGANWRISARAALARTGARTDADLVLALSALPRPSWRATGLAAVEVAADMMSFKDKRLPSGAVARESGFPPRGLETRAVSARGGGPKRVTGGRFLPRRRVRRRTDVRETYGRFRSAERSGARTRLGTSSGSFSPRFF